MWRVMIADDEPKMQRGLRSMIERMQLGIEVVGMASDGRQALAMAQELRPDLMLVDIYMPFMNGLDLIEALQKVHTDIRIIVITGFEAFEYARRAIAMRVHAYLLKPVDDTELKSALTSAMESLTKAREGYRHYDWAMHQLLTRQDSLREVFLRDLIADRYAEEEIPEPAAFFGLSNLSNCVLMLLRRGLPEVGERPMGTLMFRYALEGMLRDLLSSYDCAFLFTDDRDHVLLLVDTASPDQLAASIASVVDEELGLTVQPTYEAVPVIESLSVVYDTLLDRVARNSHLSSAVEAAKAYIAEAYRQPGLSLSDVATQAGAAPAYLSRLMKQELGLSFAKYLSMTRINHATALMANPRKSIKRIAEEVGYASPYYFSTAFKKVLGMSPNEYRNEGRDR